MKKRAKKGPFLTPQSICFLRARVSIYRYSLLSVLNTPKGDPRGLRPHPTARGEDREEAPTTGPQKGLIMGLYTPPGIPWTPGSGPPRPDLGPLDHL
jgi:hypothetical protein